MSLTTAARNVGVALAIATASFPGSTAVTAVIVFAIFQTILVALVAFSVGRLYSTAEVAA
jgi:predicted Na+-dependent transporter